MDAVTRGEAALKAGNYVDAIKHYTDAIKQSPGAATHYLKRSIAYQRTSKFSEALHDAEEAVILAVKRAKRELIAQAQLRRGIALYNLEQYGDASYCFGLAKKLDPNEKTTGMWEDKTKMKMKDMPNDDSRKQVTVKEIPEADRTKNEDVSTASTVSAAPPASSSTSEANDPETASSADPTTASAPAQTPVSKIRHDWYQTNTNVIITILAKGVPKDSVTTTIVPNSVSLSFPTASGSTYDFSLEPLFAPVDQSASSSRVLSTKIEISLKKTVEGQKWPALENNKAVLVSDETADEDAATDAVRAAVLAKPTTAGVQSPYASGNKNWDSIAKDSLRAANAKPTSLPGENEKNKEFTSAPDKNVQDLDDDDDEDKEDVNYFFKKLFKNADPETQKAMNKSYTESGGTALSTNWEEVAKTKDHTTTDRGTVSAGRR